MQKTISVIGCGWLGTRIGKYFLEKKWNVIATTTTKDKLASLSNLGFDSVQLDFANNFIEKNIQQKILESNCIVIAVPMSKTIDKTAIFKNISEYLQGYKNTVFLCSTTGVYKDLPMLFTEDANIDLLVENIVNLENIIQNAIPQTNVLRLGGLFGDDRIFSNFFLNKPIPNAMDVANHIHYKDICGVVDFLFNKKISNQILNTVTPETTSKQSIYDWQVHKIHSFYSPTEDCRVIKCYELEKLGYEFVYNSPLDF